VFWSCSALETFFVVPVPIFPTWGQDHIALALNNLRATTYNLGADDTYRPMHPVPPQPIQIPTSLIYVGDPLPTNRDNGVDCVPNSPAWDHVYNIWELSNHHVLVCNVLIGGTWNSMLHHGYDEIERHRQYESVFSEEVYFCEES